MSKLSAQVFRDAAMSIAEGRTSYCCFAIRYSMWLLNEKDCGRFDLHERAYERVFRDRRNPWWGQTATPEMQAMREMSLLFMAEMVESGDLP